MPSMNQLMTRALQASDTALSPQVQEWAWDRACRDHDRVAQVALIGRYDAPDHLVALYATLNKPATLRAAYLLRSDLSDTVITEALHGETRVAIRKVLAASSAATPEMLVILAGDEHHDVASKVLENPRCPTEALAAAVLTLDRFWYKVPRTVKQIVTTKMHQHPEIAVEVAARATHPELLKVLLTTLSAAHESGAAPLRDSPVGVTALRNIAEVLIYATLGSGQFYKLAYKLVLNLSSWETLLWHYVGLDPEDDVRGEIVRRLRANDISSKGTIERALDIVDPLGEYGRDPEVAALRTLDHTNGLTNALDVALADNDARALRVLATNPHVPIEGALRLAQITQNTAGLAHTHAHRPEVVAACVQRDIALITDRSLRDRVDRTAVLAFVMPALAAKHDRAAGLTLLMLIRHGWMIGHELSVPTRLLDLSMSARGCEELAAQVFDLLVIATGDHPERLRMVEAMLPDFDGSVGELIEVTNMILTE